jgi:hypothetical protein
MPFRLTKSASTSTDSPESFFLDLRTRKIPGLLAHQADILRQYEEKALHEADVAIQLPTGSGKTLIGLILGEWRRRNYEERVVYLCPTNQLVNQVVEQSRLKYGLKVNAFTGKKANYDSRTKNEYLNGETIAVTSYSALFNTNPFFNDPHVLILDDVHSAENYIANQWSLKIERYREAHSPLFTSLTSLLRNVLPYTDYSRLTSRQDSHWDRAWIDKLPTPTFYDLIPEIVSLIDTHAIDSELRYSWGLIRDHLHACHFYISLYEILIRPLIPPTNTHQPFSNARQRIYMSATLGAGGDLERIIGRKKIFRLQVPTGWDKQGIGRRLFLFPTRSLDDAQCEDLVLQMMQSAGRSLILVPDDPTADRIRNTVVSRIGFKTFNASEIEHSKAPFVSEKQAVAIVANRYDGIDFLDDECRLLVIEGVPQATNLQEKFIVTKMGAAALLNDRIVTRIQQAFGRCTRSATDFAAIVIWRESLNNYLIKKDGREFLHPELQAELQFGIEQSRDLQLDDFLEYLQILFDQKDDWEAADEAIVSLRRSCTQRNFPGTEDLQKAVAHELDYQYSLWYGDFETAIEQARKALTMLTASELQGYRALWRYLAGSAAWLASKNGINRLEDVARDFYSSAQSAAPAIRWLKNFPHTEQEVQKLPADNSPLLAVIERLEQVLDSMGMLSDRKFEEEEKLILQNIKQRENKKFELGHERLGRLIGFEAGNKETSGAPDPWWIVNDHLCFIFEDHSDAENSSTLNVTKARQAASHPNWVRDNLPLASDAIIIPVLVTPVKKADFDALPHLKEVFVWNIEDFRRWAEEVLSIIRELRKSFPGIGDLVWRETAMQKYLNSKIDPDSINELLRTKPAAQILK